jgi:predicted nucleic acid-binding protein
MILIDSSVWIALFNGGKGNAVSAMEKLIDDEEDVYL